MNLPFRSALLALHKSVGLASAAFLIVIGVSGSALVFENDIDRALNPAVSYVTPGRTRQSFEFLLARVRATYPADPVVGVRVGDTPDQVDEFSLRSRASAMVTPTPAPCSASAIARQVSRGGCTSSTRGSSPASSAS